MGILSFWSGQSFCDGPKCPAGMAGNRHSLASFRSDRQLRGGQARLEGVLSLTDADGGQCLRSLAGTFAEAGRLDRRIAGEVLERLLPESFPSDDQLQAACDSHSLEIREQEAADGPITRRHPHGARASTGSSRLVRRGVRAAGLHGPTMAGHGGRPARSDLVARTLPHLLRHLGQNLGIALGEDRQSLAGRTVFADRAGRNQDGQSVALLASRSDHRGDCGDPRPVEGTAFSVAALSTSLVAAMPQDCRGRWLAGRQARDVVVPQNSPHEPELLRGGVARTSPSAGRTQRLTNDDRQLHRPSHCSPAVRRGRAAAAEALNSLDQRAIPNRLTLAVASYEPSERGAGALVFSICYRAIYERGSLARRTTTQGGTRYSGTSLEVGMPSSR